MKRLPVFTLLFIIMAAASLTATVDSDSKNTITANEIVSNPETSDRDRVMPTGAGTAIDPYQIASLPNLLWVSTNSTSWGSFFYPDGRN